MASSFPGTLDSFATDRADATAMATNHAGDHNNYADAIAKIETKVGTGASTPVANSLFAGTGAGTSGWSTDPALTSVALGTTPATAGALRIPNAEWIAARNAANSGNVNIIRINSSNAIEFGASVPIVSTGVVYAATPGDRFAMSAQYTSPGTGFNSAGAFTFTGRGLNSVENRGVALRVQASDSSSVNNRTITAMSRSGTTITVTAVAHGYATSEKVVIYGVTHTFDVEVNMVAYTISNVATDTFDITVGGLSSGTYTSGGTVTNRPMLTGVMVHVSPREARGGLTGAVQNAEDLAGITVSNVSPVATAKGTDAFYVADSALITDAAWGTAFNTEAKVDTGLRVGGTIYSCGIDFINADFEPGAVPIRIPNDKYIIGRNAANSANVNIIKVNTSDQIEIGSSAFTVSSGAVVASTVALGTTPATTGIIRLPNAQAVIARNAANNTDIALIQLNSSSEVQLGQTLFVLRVPEGTNIAFGGTTGTKIASGTTQKLGFWNATPVVQPSSAGEATGFTAGAGTTATHLSTFTGNTGTKAYTVGDIVKHLKTVGLLASS